MRGLASRAVHLLRRMRAHVAPDEGHIHRRVRGALREGPWLLGLGRAARGGVRPLVVPGRAGRRLHAGAPAPAAQARPRPPGARPPDPGRQSGPRCHRGPRHRVHAAAAAPHAVHAESRERARRASPPPSAARTAARPASASGPAALRVARLSEEKSCLPRSRPCHLELIGLPRKGGRVEVLMSAFASWTARHTSGLDDSMRYTSDGFDRSH